MTEARLGHLKKRRVFLFLQRSREMSYDFFNTSVWGLLIVIKEKGEGLGRLTLRFGATRTIRPERVFLSMFCFPAVIRFSGQRP